METIILPTKRPFNWKVLLFVSVLVILASFAVIPYSFTVASITLGPDSLLLVVVSGVLNALIYGGLGAIGLYLAARIGLGLPFVEGWLKKEPIQGKFRGVAATAVIIGVIVGIAIIVLDIAVFGPPMQAEFESLHVTIPESVQPPAW